MTCAGCSSYAVLLLAVTRLLVAQQFSDFEGTWVLKFNGQSILKLTLVTERGRLAGSLTEPSKLAFDSDGGFTTISPEKETLPVQQAALNLGRLQLTIDGDRYVMISQNANRASLALEDRGPWPMRPWRLERAVDPDAVILATKLQEPEYPREIVILRDQLRAMIKEDQDARLKFDHARIDAADTKNRSEVLRIFHRYGWVTDSLAGKDAAHNFFLLVQHQTPAIQRQLLPALERAARNSDASMNDYAYLYDRVQFGLGKLQHWGSQTYCQKGKPVLAPVDDPATLDARRKELYMAPIGEYLKMDYIIKVCAQAGQ
jgi:hypothetical protein